jgi:hypothetical protein
VTKQTAVELEKSVDSKTNVSQEVSSRGLGIQSLNHVRSNRKLLKENSLKSIERSTDLQTQVKKLDNIEKEWNQIKGQSINFSFEVLR